MPTAKAARRPRADPAASRQLLSPSQLTGRYRALTLAMVMVLAVSAGIYLTFKTRAATVAYPLKLNANQRNLVDQNGQPVFMDIDTAWTFLSAIPDRAEADAYLDARKAQGFNTVMSFATGFRSKNATKAGIPAFINGDRGKPNDAYFATVDQLVQDAGARGMQVLLGPVNLSSNGTDDPDGLPTLAQWQALGTYLGNRYKNFDNIIWLMGGNHDVQQTWADTTDYTPYIDAMANAIKAADPRHLMTYYPAVDTYVLAAKPWLDFYAFQENRADSSPYSYMRVKGYYEYAPVKPVIDLEPGYETGDALTGATTTPYMVRRNAWWAFLQGALGVTYGGNRATWAIDNDGTAFKWRPYIGLGGDKQTGLMAAVVAGYNWQNLTPDSTHQVVTTGYGTYGSRDFVTAGFSPDGNLAMVYLPISRTIAVNMAKFSAPVQGYWYDPSTGTVSTIGTGFVNGGTKTFATPGNNAAGQSDWLLVLTTGQSGAGPAPAGTVTPRRGVF
ncbi:MAG TPA: DUF4038 domain-containing protein [Candidatus Saccharimonadia bacterium]